MDWLNRLNQAIGYMEDHLDGEIDYDRLAQIACCSTFHFQRMFSYMAEIPLSEYIRRRRMTAAALELAGGKAKVLDLALKYGYESPTSFTRAFQSVHGLSPSMAQKKGAKLKAFPRIQFQLSIKGDAEMNYRIEKKDAFRMVGVKEHYPTQVEESFMKVPQFWTRTTQSGTVQKILALLNQPPFGLLGVSTCMNGKDFDYYIAVSTDKPVPEGMEAYEVPACTWAIFECVGAMPAAIQELQKRVISEWLPASGYEYADAPDIEVYFEGDQQSPDYRCEVWLPITKK